MRHVNEYPTDMKQPNVIPGFLMRVIKDNPDVSAEAFHGSRWRERGEDIRQFMTTHMSHLVKDIMMIKDHCFTEKWLDRFKMHSDHKRIDKIILEKLNSVIANV